MNTPMPLLQEDPFAVLGVPAQADDQEIRTAYRQAVRQHPPEHDPVGFKRIRQAYEAVRDPDARVAFVLFGSLQLPDLPPLTPEDLGARAPTPVSLAEVLAEAMRLALCGTDLDGGDHGQDLRDPPE